MENNNNFYNPATEKQIAYLKKLGYQGNTDGLTSGECSQLIMEYSGKGTTQASGTQATNQKKESKNEVVKSASKEFNITTSNGNEISLSRDAIDKYVCANLSDTEYSYLSAVCKNYGLNPYLKEIYAIKFGNQPATFIIDYKVLQQAVDREPMFDGIETGILYIDKNGNEKERQGQFILDGETFIAGWCKVFRKDRQHANKVYAMYSECVQCKNDGTPNSNWSKKPIFMTVKVAKTWALRETFPNWFSPNTYTADEIEPKSYNNSKEFIEANVEDVNKKQVEGTASQEFKVDEDTGEVEDANLFNGFIDRK